MIKFITPANLNGAELCNEIETAGIQVNRRTSPMIDGSGDFWLDIAEADKAKATPIVAAHNGTLVAPEQTIQGADVRLEQLRIHKLWSARIKARKSISICNRMKSFSV